MRVKGITRTIVLSCFFVNITALLLTYLSMAIYPCVEGVKVCIIEMNPIADSIIQSGGFPISILLSLIFWVLVFIYFEVIVIGKYHEKMPKFTIGLPSMLLFVLLIDLINDIVVLVTMPLVI